MIYPSCSSVARAKICSQQVAISELLQNSLTANYYGKCNGQHVFASQACTFILDYNKYRVVTGYHYISLSMKQTSATAVASVLHAGGALHMM
jgi:hypothetical protein